MHGRMPSIATGALLANRTMLGLGVTGDGDTASIGIGQFMHLVRRNLPLIYIIENNGVYGLTKGQFSATADIGSTREDRRAQRTAAVRLLRAGAEVGRDFCGALLQRRQEAASGDPEGRHRAQRTRRDRRDFALRDLQRSRRLHQELRLHEGTRRWRCTSWISCRSSKTSRWKFPKAKCAMSSLHDGSHLRIRKLDRDFDPTNRLAALAALEEAESKGEVLTGVLYVNTSKPTFIDLLNLSDEPLATLPEAKLRPSQTVLDEVMEQLR